MSQSLRFPRECSRCSSQPATLWWNIKRTTGVQTGYKTTTYTTYTVPVPVCTACGAVLRRRHNAALLVSLVLLVGLIIAGIALSPEHRGAGAFGGIMIGVLLVAFLWQTDLIRLFINHCRLGDYNRPVFRNKQYQAKFDSLNPPMKQ